MWMYRVYVESDSQNTRPSVGRCFGTSVWTGMIWRSECLHHLATNCACDHDHGYVVAPHREHMH